MGFRMSCDRCGRFMKNVKISELKSIRDDEIVCPVCQRVETRVKSDIERIKKLAEAKFNKELIRYKEMIVEAIQKTVGEENGTEA